MTDSQLEAWNEIVAAAKRDAANHRLAMRAPHNTAYERTILRRKLVRCEAILAVDEVVQRIRQIEEAPGASTPSWTIAELGGPARRGRERAAFCMGRRIGELFLPSPGLRRWLSNGNLRPVCAAPPILRV